MAGHLQEVSQQCCGCYDRMCRRQETSRMQCTDALHTPKSTIHHIVQARKQICGCSIDVWPCVWLQG